MGLFKDLIGTSEAVFQILKGGVKLKNSSGNLLVRNAADNADAQITVSRLNVSGQTTAIVLNSDAAGSGADWTITIQVPTSGMTGNYALTLPTDDGSPGQVWTTDGSGNSSWTTIAGGANKIDSDTTTLAFGSSSPLTLFTLPANAQVFLVQVYVDTVFDGTAPTVTVGISGNTTKYMGADDNDLKVAEVYEATSKSIPVGTTESLIATYSADSSSAGSARIVIWYAVPA